MKSKFLSLATNDFVKGLIVSIIAAVLGYAYQVYQSNSFTALNWHDIVKIAIGGGLAYLSKNFITNSNGYILNKEQK